ncbi:ectonucleoside triphosphate diphosphohydrolase 1-like isoform X2 [Ruditapes philippinarum]|uniref:ectonucleoside triphosphate diphosphohydrolase 1-like isoform X2 n=1 Tax=Ruditapes philippinarum TaxID=129788 RepID=UPI00295B8474|nr:ectonucleoside triphosphate diphosphohydrolase 1-like isoform X2 [Ruditapes philippinarum]
MIRNLPMEMHMVFLLCMSTHFAVTTAESQTSDQHDDSYGIIMDGGSTGTKLKVYKWNHRTSGTLPDGQDSKPGVVRNLQLVKSTKFKPGISQIAGKPDELKGYLDKIMQNAVKEVPKDKHSDTPIYFMATAGLRVLQINETEDLLTSIEHYMQTCPFLTPENSVRVISGEEEGVFAWVAANYLRGFFWSNKPPSQAVGVLEMGGGSTQIAFLPDHSIYANMFPVQIGDVTYLLYAHSYLFYGQNYIVSRINDYLIAQNAGSNLNIKNPCMLKGDNTTVLSSGNSVHIMGSSNSSQCLEIIEIFLKTAADNWCYPKPCAIGRTYQPSVGNLVFYAISAFVYSPTYLNALDELGRLDMQLLKTNAVQYCQKTLSEVVATGLNAEYASPYCLMGLYIPSLLMNAYDFQADRNIVFVKSKINEIDIDWALGAMLQFTQNEDNFCTISAMSSYHIWITHTTLASVILYTAIQILF